MDSATGYELVLVGVQLSHRVHFIHVSNGSSMKKAKVAYCKNKSKRRNKMSKLSIFNRMPLWDMSTFNSLMDEVFRDFESASHSMDSIKGRPVNRGYLKDEKGNVTNIILETIYTPFKKKDVNVSVTDDILTISMGVDSESNNLSTDVDYDYKSISKKSVEMKFKLLGDVDQDKISAEAEDGVLKINIPIVEVAPTSRQIKLK